MMMNNGTYGVNYGVPGGYVMPNAQQAQFKVTNPVFKVYNMDELRKLGNNGLNLKLTPIEANLSKCTHHMQGTGEITTIQNDDGTVTCSLCGETFRLINIEDSNSVSEIVENMINLIQSIKIVEINPTTDMEDYYQLIPMLKRLPELAKYSVSKMNSMNNAYGTFNTNTPNSYMMFNNLMTGMPVVGQGAPIMGMAPQYATNGFGYNGPQVINNGAYGYPNQQMIDPNTGMPLVTNAPNVTNMQTQTPVYAQNGPNMNQQQQQATTTVSANNNVTNNTQGEKLVNTVLTV